MPTARLGFRSVRRLPAPYRAVLAALLILILPVWAAVVSYGVLAPADDGFTNCSGVITSATFRYSGDEVGFLSVAYGVLPLICSAGHYPPGSEIVLDLGLESSSHLPHWIVGVDVAPPFRLASLGPSMPLPVDPGENISIQVAFLLPPGGGGFSTPGVIVSAD